LWRPAALGAELWVDPSFLMRTARLGRARAAPRPVHATGNHQGAD
jgi:hypothetical protein